ncbi:hypothetical protein O0L34_g8337 [Tuta absoluta]|nr:hypothetical protein O0L34_g8337 [Tuta absoluta]
MVIQDESDAPVEVSVMKTPHSDAKKYVIVKNHVRELPISDRASSGHTTAQDDSSESELNAKKLKKSAKKESKVINKDTHVIPPQNESEHARNVQLDVASLVQELRREFREGFSKIQAKLDQIMQLIEPGSSSQRNNLTESTAEEDCQCKLNTKIIFDEDGQQKSACEPTPENHVCLKKLKRKYSDVAKNIDIHTLAMAQKSNADTRNLDVEYEEQNVTLPEDLVSLTNILQDSDIAISYRNKVIDKVKLLKQEHLNEIRFNRPSIIEKLKSAGNNEVFEFKGANICSLPGYPDWKKL